MGIPSEISLSTNKPDIRTRLAKGENVVAFDKSSGLAAGRAAAIEPERSALGAERGVDYGGQGGRCSCLMSSLPILLHAV